MRKTACYSWMKDDAVMAAERIIEPPRLEGEINLKLREKGLHRTRKYYAVLTRGFLRLFTNRNAEHYKYQIDLGKISLQEENGSLVLVFRVESQLLTTVDIKEFPKWKDALMRHHRYRKCLLRNQSNQTLTNSPSESASSMKDEEATGTSTPVDDFEDWDAADMCLKMIDDIQKMQGLTCEVLERIEALCIEMRMVASELASTVGLIQSGHNLSEADRSKLSNTLNTTLSRITEESVPTLPSGELISLYDDEAFGAKLMEFADEDLAVEMNSNMTLHSLKATSNIEEKKREVIQNCLKILNKTNPLCKSNVPVPQQPTYDAVTALQTTATQQQDNNGKAKTSSAEIEISPTKSQSIITITEPPSCKPRTVQQQGKPHREYRKALPAVQCPSERISFSALGRMILQRTGVPISHYEPLTALQLLCEELRFSDLLNKACAKGTAEERMVYVAAFALSPYTNSTGRYRKFFNPLLGETYEYEQEDFKYHGEQVSHHPSVSAGHATGNGWTWFQTFSAEVIWNAWAQTCEFVPERPIRLQLIGEEYMWNKITTHIESLLCVPEQRKVYHEGTIRVKCSNGVKAIINVAKNKEISGEVISAEGKTFCKFSGKWDERLCREVDGGEKEQLIVISDWPLYKEYFGFSDFTLRLNELHEEDRPFLPPTDSRFRPDVRSLEDGKLDDAIAYKKSLEQAQRDRAINELTYKPLWFVQKEDTFTNKKIFVSTGKYWEAKETKFEQQKKDNTFIPIFTVSITN